MYIIAYVVYYYNLVFVIMIILNKSINRMKRKIHAIMNTIKIIKLSS